MRVKREALLITTLVKRCKPEHIALYPYASVRFQLNRDRERGAVNSSGKLGATQE